MPSNPKNTVSTVISGPRVRILLPPAGSQVHLALVPHQVFEKAERLNYKASGGKKDTRFEIMLDPSHVTSKACDDRFSLHSNGHCERRPVQADWL
jgi:hypothetical protein